MSKERRLGRGLEALLGGLPGWSNSAAANPPGTPAPDAQPTAQQAAQQVVHKGTVPFSADENRDSPPTAKPVAQTGAAERDRFLSSAVPGMASQKLRSPPSIAAARKADSPIVIGIPEGSKPISAPRRARSGKNWISPRASRRLPLLARPAVWRPVVVRHCWTSQQWRPHYKVHP